MPNFSPLKNKVLQCLKIADCFRNLSTTRWENQILKIQNIQRVDFNQPKRQTWLFVIVFFSYRKKSRTSTTAASRGAVSRLDAAEPSQRPGTDGAWGTLPLSTSPPALHQASRKARQLPYTFRTDPVSGVRSTGSRSRGDGFYPKSRKGTLQRRQDLCLRALEAAGAACGSLGQQDQWCLVPAKKRFGQKTSQRKRVNELSW